MGEARSAPRLMLVTDRRRSRRPLAELVEAAVAGGVDAVQVREPDLAVPDLTELLVRLRQVIAGRAALLVNGAAGLAAELGIGLHLPERGGDLVAARRLIGPNRLLGRSVHSADAAAAANTADYLLAGHVFATPSKPGRAPLGASGLRRIAAAAPVPVLAVGGITAETAKSVIEAGAVGVAVIGAIADAADPECAAAALRSVVDDMMEDRMGATVNDTMTAEQAAIVVNGKAVDVISGTTLARFLADRGLTASMAIVERNGEIVDRGAYDATVLASGDELEVVHAVGGG